MKIKVNYEYYIAFYEEFANIFVAKAFPGGRLPVGKNIYSMDIWTHNEKIKTRALDIFGDGTRDPAFFRKFIYRFNKNDTPGIDRVALLRALTYWFQQTDNDFMLALPKKSTEELTEYMWLEFCKRQ